MTNAVESSSASQIISYNHTPLPVIKVPFPPEINAQDLIVIREAPDGTRKLSTRAPNAFIIFRKQFVKTARDEGHFLPMTVISSMASSAWENEKEEVRAEYKRIAREAHIKRKAMYPKTNNRRKRKEKWNLVSFQQVNSVNKPISQEISNSPSSTTTTTNTENITTTETENTTTTNAENIKNDIPNNFTPEDLPILIKTNPVLNYYYPSPSYVSYDESPDLSYTSYNEVPDLSYTSYNESPNPSYYSYSDSGSNSTSPNLDSNINSNINSNQNFNLYDNVEQYPISSPYLISISDDNVQGYDSINENNIHLSNFYDDDWNLENGIVSSISSNENVVPSTNLSTNASTTNTPRLDTLDFITINNTTPILTQNNYEIIDLPTNFNDAIIYNNDVISYSDLMIQPLIMMK